MFRVIIISLILVFQSYCLLGQTQLDWIALSDLKLEQKMNEEFGTSFDQATFSEHIKALNGQEVFISGYMIPLDALGTSFALSRNPNASCFFCGNAGPETVLRLWFIPKAMKRYNTDDFLKIKGRLKIHASNENGFIYELVDALPI